MTEVFKNIFEVKIPLPDSPLRELNCFIVRRECEGGRSLVVDVGFNSDEGERALLEAFSELGISLADTDIFITHLHADHSGLCDRLTGEGSLIFASAPDAEIINLSISSPYFEKLLDKQTLMGFPDSACLRYEGHPAYGGGTRVFHDFSIVSPGQTLCYGGYCFEVLDLKGHTPGQIGLFDRECRVLFCGDHILSRITPNINLWDFDFDYLGLFLENLKMVKGLDVLKLFSAHRAPVLDVPGRIDELLAHHEARLLSCVSVLEQRPHCVYDIAAKLKWDFGGGDFSSFPPTQKWFAGSEVFAHVEHLRHLGRVRFSVSEDGVYVYSLA